MKGMSFLKVAQLKGKSQSYIANLVYKFQLETFYFRGRKLISNESVEKILSYSPSIKKPYKNHPRKISIVESYIRNQSIKAVARTLRINRESVTEAIKEWEQDGYITVESKINGSGKENYNGVYKKGKYWVYDTNIGGKKVYKGQFKTEEDAFSALVECRKENS